MPALRVVSPVTATTSPTTKSKIDTTMTGMVTTAELQTKVSSAVEPYALKTYVDAQDGNLTTKSYVDTQDALYIPNSWKGVSNGVCELSGGAVPESRFPQVPVLPMWPHRTYWNSDFTDIGASGTGTSEVNILNTTFNLPTNLSGAVWRPLCFGNFEAWATTAGSSSGKPVIKVYINGYLQAYGAGRNGGGSVASCPITVVPVGDDTGHVPTSGFNGSSASIRVTLSSVFSGTSVTYDPTLQTLLTVFLATAGSM